jgi:hypothetical protein
MSKQDMSKYFDLEKELSNLPMTWYPALIIHLVETAYQKNVFVPGGATVLVNNLEKKLGKEKQDG